MLLDAVEWLGHSGFRIRAGAAVVYIDPYRVGDGPAADLILITHGHYDHFSPQDVEQLTGKRTLVVAPPPVAERLSGRVQSIAPGEAIEPDGVRGVEVRAIAAYNTSKRDASGKVFHPRDAGGATRAPVIAGRRGSNLSAARVRPDSRRAGHVARGCVRRRRDRGAPRLLLRKRGRGRRGLSPRDRPRRPGGDGVRHEPAPAD